MQIIQALTQTISDYPIYVGSNLLSKDLLASILGDAKLLLVTDERVADLHLNKVLNTVTVHQTSIVILPAGEQHKNWHSVQQILEALELNRHDRYSTIISLGGGVIGDLTGFAASIYMRGINWVNIPTTLLAQVDSAIGGKTGCNFFSNKNLIGTFYQPRAIISEISFLQTLPEREYRSGIVEIIKYGVACNADFFKWLEHNISALVARKEEVLVEAIVRSSKIKSHIVQQDTQDHSSRRSLNFGHTFAHAIESITEFKVFMHGEAVAIGMLLATQLAVKLCLVDNDLLVRLHKIISYLALSLEWKLASKDLCALYDFMRNDKKKQGKELCFILPCCLGAVKVFNGVKFEYIEEIIESYASIFDHC